MILALLYVFPLDLLRNFVELLEYVAQIETKLPVFDTNKLDEMIASTCSMQ